MKKKIIWIVGIQKHFASMNTKKNQPLYSEAKKSAITDILEDLHKEGRVFISYHPKRTININIIIASQGMIEPDPFNEEDI